MHQILHFKQYRFIGIETMLHVSKRLTITVSTDAIHCLSHIVVFQRPLVCDAFYTFKFFKTFLHIYKILILDT